MSSKGDIIGVKGLLMPQGHVLRVDLGKHGRGRAYQSQLSFTRTTGQQGAAVNTNILGSIFDVSTEGQRGSSRTIQAGKVVDEKKPTDEKFVCARGRR